MTQALSGIRIIDMTHNPGGADVHELVFDCCGQ